MTQRLGAAAQIHRFKNPFWGFLDTPELALGMIGDGFHLPPEVVRTALKVKGHDRCYMVSDANAYSGCPPGEYRRPSGIVDYIEPDGFMHTADRDVLAGAWFQLDHGVEFLTGKCGLAFEDAWRLCSEIPAAICGADLPRLRPDDEASFAVWDGKIVNTVFRGEEFPAERYRGAELEKREKGAMVVSARPRSTEDLGHLRCGAGADTRDQKNRGSRKWKTCRPILISPLWKK